MCVERDERARTGSQQSAAERRRLKRGAACPTAVKSSLPTPSPLSPAASSSRTSPALRGSKQAHERCPSARCKLTHAHQPLGAEAHALRTAFQRLHSTEKAENMCVYCPLPSGQSFRPVCGGQRFRESSFSPENQIIANGSILQAGIF